MSVGNLVTSKTFRSSITSTTKETFLTLKTYPERGRKVVRNVIISKKCVFMFLDRMDRLDKIDMLDMSDITL